MGTLIMISGANGSGKSRYAERIVARTTGERYYIATMRPCSEENLQRIEKHREQRKDLQFTTLECPYQVGAAAVERDGVVLLEDVSNLLANAMFERGGDEASVYADIEALCSRCRLLVAVTITGLRADGYDGETAAYIRALNGLNQRLYDRAAAAVAMKDARRLPKRETSMRLFESLLIALSTYSAVPVPQLDWNEKNMRYAICFFPAVGVLCGAALWLWAVLAQATGMSGVLFAAIAACLPILVTGGIHMDGYLDTVDALSSHQTREKKLAIMKDANCGAFAVIYGGVYLLAYAGFAYEVFAAGHILLICPLFVLSRALSGLCAVNLPNARKSGMLCAFTSGVQRRTATAALALAGLTAVATMVWMSPAVGGMAAAFAVVSALKYRRFALAQFGGVTGDTSGFFLQLCEFCGLIGIWIGGLL